MSNGLLLWVDDEIELPCAYIILLEKRGYQVVTVNNGSDAISQCRQHTSDLVLLDEMISGLIGLKTLQRIKEISPATSVVMVTKSGEENIMDQVIGSKIADYLIKPMNPNQILLTLKKNIHRREIVTEVTQPGYQQSFQDISMQITNCQSLGGWIDIYKRLVHWELELSSTDSSMTEMLQMQKEEVDLGFAKYIRQRYLRWVAPFQTSRPMMSPDLSKSKTFLLFDAGEKVSLTAIDNFRYDQWRVTSKEIGNLFDMQEDIYVSVLPMATQYARNAIFSGLMPNKIAEMSPYLWVNEDEEEDKNLNEEPFIQTQIERYCRYYSFSYNKVNDSSGAEKLFDKLHEFKKNDSDVLVVNFIDMLSHAHTESKMVRELANNELVCRSITKSWSRYSMMTELMKLLSQNDYEMVLITDHDSIRAPKPIETISDRNTNINLRYKLGKNSSYSAKGVFTIKDPWNVQLPSPNISTSYAFATGDIFFAYPNNYNYCVSYYKDTFQHGGISMEEMLILLIILTPKKR